MKVWHLRFIWTPGGNKVELMGGRKRYIWHTNTSMTGFATLLKARLENMFEGVHTELKPVNPAVDLMIVEDQLDLWTIEQVAKDVSKALAILEFIDKGEWHQPDEVVE